MTRTPRPPSPRRRAQAFGAAVLYVLSAAILPVLHAQVEDVAGRVTVEQTHSSQCDRIHSDISCPAAGMLRAVPGQGAPFLGAPVARTMSPVGVAFDQPIRPGTLTSVFIRGPPAA